MGISLGAKGLIAGVGLLALPTIAKGAKDHPLLATGVVGALSLAGIVGPKNMGSTILSTIEKMGIGSKLSQVSMKSNLTKLFGGGAFALASKFSSPRVSMREHLNAAKAAEQAAAEAAKRPIKYSIYDEVRETTRRQHNVRNANSYSVDTRSTGTQPGHYSNTTYRKDTPVSAFDMDPEAISNFRGPSIFDPLLNKTAGIRDNISMFGDKISSGFSKIIEGAKSGLGKIFGQKPNYSYSYSSARGIQDAQGFLKKQILAANNAKNNANIVQQAHANMATHIGDTKVKNVGILNRLKGGIRTMADAVSDSLNSDQISPNSLKTSRTIKYLETADYNSQVRLQTGKDLGEHYETLANRTGKGNLSRKQVNTIHNMDSEELLARRNAIDITEIKNDRQAQEYGLLSLRAHQRGLISNEELDKGFLRMSDMTRYSENVPNTVKNLSALGKSIGLQNGGQSADLIAGYKKTMSEIPGLKNSMSTISGVYSPIEDTEGVQDLVENFANRAKPMQNQRMDGIPVTELQIRRNVDAMLKDVTTPPSTRTNKNRFIINHMVGR